VEEFDAHRPVPLRQGAEKKPEEHPNQFLASQGATSDHRASPGRAGEEESRDEVLTQGAGEGREERRQGRGVCYPIRSMWLTSVVNRKL